MTKNTIQISRLITFILGGVFASVAGHVSAQTLPVTSGLQLWLKADAGVATNSAGLVTGWTDSSGNGNNAAPTNNNTSFSPTYLANSLNGLPTLRFPGGSKFLDVPDVSVSPASTISGLTNNVTIIVLKEDDSFAGYRAGVAKSMGNAPGPFDTYNNAAASAGQSIFYLRHGTANVSVTGNAFKPQPGVYEVLSYTYANGSVKQYINDAVSAYFNAFMQPNGNSNAIWSAANGPGPLRIGAREDLVTQLVGNMAEVLIYQPALTDAQLFDVVNNYLKPKWGLSFDPAPVVSVTSPVNGATAAANSVVPVVISASSPTGMVTSVSLYGNGSLIGTTTSTNYNLAVSSVTPGPVTFTAVATDQLGRPATSAPVSITFTGPAAPTTPPSTGLKVWLDAAYGVTTNADGTVSSWADESLSGNTATGVTNEPYSNISGTNAPTVEPVWSNNVANGRPIVHFNGSNSILAIPDSGVTFLTGDFTTFAVVRFSQAFFSTPQTVWTKASNNLPCPVDWYFPSSGQTIAPLYTVSGNTTIERGNGAAGNSGATSPSTAAISLNQFDNVGVMYQGTAVTMYSGAHVYYSNVVASPPGDGAGNLPLTIGMRDDGGTALYGDIAEILIYQGAQSPAAIQNIAAYLNGKYNIAQPVYANPPPTVTITSPSAGALAAPSTVSFTANANSAFGSVTNVALYANGIRLANLASASSGTYSVQVNLLTPGVVTLTAVATDNWGIQTTSAPVVVTLTGSAAVPPITNGLALWLKPDAGIVTNSAGNVIEWDDQSGAGNNAYQPSFDNFTPGIPPLLIPNAQNGYPVVRFTPPTNETSSNVFLDIADNGTITPSAGTSFAIFAVTRIPAYGNYYEILSDCSPNTGDANPFEYRINQTSGVAEFILGNGTGNGPGATAVAAPPASSTYFSIEGVVVANGAITHYLQLNTNGTTASSYIPASSGYPIRVGGRNANNGTMYTMNGDIAEIQVYTNAVGTAEVGEIVNYLSDKYGLPQVQLAVNPPAITVVALTNALAPSTNVTAPGVINIGAQIVSAAAISSVNFIVNGQTVATQTSPPYQIPLEVLTPGKLTIVVQASDIYGFSSNSVPYTITIPGNDALLPSAPPTNGLVLWLKADAGVTTNSDGTIALWADQSGETNNASTDPGGASAPSLVTDPTLGVPVVSFNPQGFPMCLDVADAPSVELTSDMSLFYAAEFASYTNTLPQTIVAKTFGSSAFPFDYLVTGGTASYVRADNDGSSAINSTSPLPAGQYIVGGATVLSSVVTHYLNNVGIGSGTLGYGALDGGTPLKVGSRDDFLAQLSGNLGEVLLYGRALTGGDLQLADTYLAGRYGIAIVQLESQTPSVGIIGAGTNGVDIAWPPGYAGWVLESSTNLLKWTAVSTNPPNNQISVNPTNKATFYRLQIQ